MKYFFLLSFILLISVSSKAQIDKDSLYRADSLKTFKRANKALLLSTVLPGAGQVYNKKIWKVPVIYTGIGVLAYSAISNNKDYKNYKTALLYRLDGDTLTTDEEFANLTDDQVRDAKDFYRRNRDLSYILLGILYGLNIVDAYVDAQLSDFDVSDNLSLSASPTFINRGQIHAGGMLQLTFKF